MSVEIISGFSPRGFDRLRKLRHKRGCLRGVFVVHNNDAPWSLRELRNGIEQVGKQFLAFKGDYDKGGALHISSKCDFVSELMPI